jgi:hypothetical protein
MEIFSSAIYQHSSWFFNGFVYISNFESFRDLLLTIHRKYLVYLIFYIFNLFDFNPMIMTKKCFMD